MKYVIFFFVFANVCFAQADSIAEALKYYPLNTGDYWEYKSYSSYFPYGDDSSAYSMEVLGDTILPNNYSYKNIAKKDIPLSRSEEFIFERIDTLTACVYRYKAGENFVNDEFLVDSLLAKPGDYFSGSWTGYFSFSASTHCLDEFEDTILNKSTTVKYLRDESFIPGENIWMAKGFGYIHSNSIEFGYGSTWLVYSRINGSKYGSQIVNVSQDEVSSSVNKFMLKQNYPNPFNPATAINYSLPEDGMVTIKVYDILGREIKTLVNEYKTKGRYEVNFDASNLASGFYIYEINCGSYKASKKMSLIK